MVENPRLVLGLKVRALRRQRGETLRSLAGRSGLSISYLSEIEKGKKYPKPERLVRLAEALEVQFDELVSMQVDDRLTQLKKVFNSPLLRGFPFDLFGLESEDLLALVSGNPERGSALLRAIAEVGRSYDVHVEHFLLAALRAHQQLHGNYFDELEADASAFRRKHGWRAGQRISEGELAELLRKRWGYRIDEQRLGEDVDLARFRSVHSGGATPVLFVNPRLMSSQKTFVLAREIGHCHLGLAERAVSSPWLGVESFDRVFNNFKASYFAGALLMGRRRFHRDLRQVMSAGHWDASSLAQLMDDYGTTPETLLHRMTQIAPRQFGFHEFFFVRFSTGDSRSEPRLTKWLNTSEVAVPRGFGLSESYCRRWPAFRLLEQDSGLKAPEDRLVSAERVRFLDDQVEFLQLSVARPLALAPGALSAVSVGFKVDDNLRRRVAFLDDPAIPRVEVDLTCERCRLTDCSDRVAPATAVAAAEAQERRRTALERLLQR